MRLSSALMFLMASFCSFNVLAIDANARTNSPLKLSIFAAKESTDVFKSYTTVFKFFSSSIDKSYAG